MGINANSEGLKYCDQLSDESNNICYISLNNIEEKKELEEKYQSNPKVNVIELASAGEDPFSSIKRNMDAISSCGISPPCSQIVVSGHQNGSFWGELSSGDLTPGDLMLLSCEVPELKSVNSVWLQGCNTIDENAPKVPYDPQVYDQTDQLFSLNNLRRGILSNVDQVSNPSETGHQANYDVTDGYANAFPGANLHGWQGIAPGVGSGSAKSLILHLQQSIEFLLENNINSTSVEEANLYLQARRQELEGKGVSRELNRNYNSVDFISKIQRDLEETLGQENFNCLWQVYQEKYFETQGEKKRRPRSSLSAQKRNINFNKEFCNVASAFKDPGSSPNQLESTIEKLLVAPGPMKQKLRAIESLMNKGNLSQKNKQMLKKFLSKDSSLIGFLESEFEKEESLATKLDTFNMASIIVSEDSTSSARERFNKTVLEKKVRGEVDQNLADLIKKNPREFSEIDHSEEVLDWLKLLEESVEGDFLSRKSWELIGQNFSKLPEFAQHRIISLADREHSSKIPPRLKRLVDGRQTVMQSLDSGEISLSEMKQSEQVNDTGVDPYRLLEESDGPTLSKAQVNKPSASRVSKEDTRTPSSSTAASRAVKTTRSTSRQTEVSTNANTSTSRTSPKITKRCIKKPGYKFNPYDFKSCNDFKNSSREARSKGVRSYRDFPPGSFKEVPICFKYSALRGVTNSRQVFDLPLLGKTCVGARSSCGGEKCKSYRCAVSPLYNTLSESYCGEIIDPGYCRLYMGCKWVD